MIHVPLLPSSLWQCRSDTLSLTTLVRLLSDAISLPIESKKVTDDGNNVGVQGTAVDVLNSDDDANIPNTDEISANSDITERSNSENRRPSTSDQVLTTNETEITTMLKVTSRHSKFFECRTELAKKND